MATGSFYAYFDSKEEIFAAVVRAINRGPAQRDEGGPGDGPTAASGRGSASASACTSR